MCAHINEDGQFQSDKYPTCPAGKVPLSVKDKGAQDLLWLYAQRRRPIDAEFSADLETSLKNAGFKPHCESCSDEIQDGRLCERCVEMGVSVMDLDARAKEF